MSTSATMSAPHPADDLIDLPKIDPTTSNDRCDRCGESTAAVVWYVKPDLKFVTGMAQVMLCRHHSLEHGAVLVEKGFQVQFDNSPSLFHKPNQ